MATIQTAINLYDGVTGPLENMNRAMNAVLNTFESMEQAFGRAVDTAAVQQTREAWERTGTAFESAEAHIREADERQRNFNRSVRDGSRAANGLLSTIRKVAVAAGGIAGIKKTISISDELASTKARLNLLVDDGGSVAELEKKIMASAQRSRSAYFDTAAAVAKLGLNAGNAFNNDMNQVIAFMEQVNKQFVIGGATAQEQSNAMVQLTQAMAAGALRGEELNSILDGAPGIARAIEKYMGIAEGSIKSVAQDGKVTAEVVKNAMFAMAKETNEKFESMPKTWAQIGTSMKKQALSMFAPILTKLNQIANSSKFQQVTTGLINGLAGVAAVAASTLDILLSIASAVGDNWGSIQPIVMGAAAAMLLYNGYLAVNNAMTAVSNAQKGLAAVQAYRAAAANTALAAAEQAHAMATASATAAQYGFNAALLTCPIAWIILGIITVIALVYAVIAAVNRFQGTSISVAGTVCGVISIIGALIANVVITAINILIDAFVWIYNAVAALWNFVNNVANDTLGSIVRLVADVVDQVLSLLQTLASAIDTIFGKNLSSAVQGWRNSLEGLVEKTFGNGKEVMVKMNAQENHLTRFEYSTAFDKGYDFGKGIEDKVSGMFDFSNLDSMGAGFLDAFNFGNDLDNIYGNTGDIANNTAATANALDIAEEDLTYLRDIAEREAINRYTTAEIKVEQHNENYISKDTDLDGILDIWAADFSERLDISAEGVHW